ncbi:MAG: isocitrate/isopropylmalate dehydrogenase family protein [Gemmatimonadota bacterium]|jgi:3-isopropylmalate dehydrogenase
MTRIAVIPGDGIGREVTGEATRVLRAVAAVHGIDLDLVDWELGAERYLERGVTITDAEFRSLADEHDAILLGALGDPRVPGHEHARDILLGLRFRLDLYVNYRPCVLLDPSHCPLRGSDRAIDIHVFRENTEGAYVDMGGILRRGTPDEVAIQEDVNTRKGVERIVRVAFDFARRRGMESVTLVDKANAMPAAGGLWRRVFEEVGEEYDLLRNAVYVDAMAMDLVRRPERYSVVVASNLFGDMVSDLAAEIAGGLGLAPSANVHPGGHALFEPVHGSAPDIAGTGTANPLGAIRCTALLLEYFGHVDAAIAVERAVRASLAEGPRTPDVGGRARTADVGEWIAGHVEAHPPRAEE